MHIKDALRPILSANYRNLLRDSILATNQCESKQKLVIDFSSPNIAKPFHFGHLKSTLLGNYLANINEFLGNQVIRLNYIGDWGTQYGLLSLGLEKFEADLSSASSNQRLRRLLDIYVQANELGKSDETFYAEARRRFKELGEDIDSKHYKKWREIRDLSLEELKKSYDAIGIRFDEFEFESDHAKDLNPMIKQLEGCGVAQRLADGLVSARVERNGRFLDIPVLKADGTSLYITRDIAAAVRRKEKYNFDKMLYVVGCDQEKHFYCLSNLVKSLGHDWHDQLIHVKMGKVLGMSSRHGTSILLSDIIQEATQRYIERTKNTPTSKVDASRRDELENVGKNLALSALFIHDMRYTRTKNYSFDWDRVMCVTDRSGINLQTTYARLCSLLDRNRSFGNEPYNHVDELSPDAVDCIEAAGLLEHLDELAKVIGSSHLAMDPSHLVNHAFVLCRAINRARQSEKLWIMGESDKEFARTRLTMFMAARVQLGLIIELLGLRPLSKV